MVRRASRPCNRLARPSVRRIDAIISPRWDWARRRTRHWACVGKLYGRGIAVAGQMPGVESDGFISNRRLTLEQQPTTTSRRAFLKAMAGAAGALVLAACGGSPNGGGNGAQAPTAEPAAAPAAGATAAPAPAAATAAPVAAPTGAAASGRVLVNPQIDTAGIKKGGTLIRGDVTDVRTLNP